MHTPAKRRRQAPDRARLTELHVDDGRTLRGLLRERGKGVAA